MGGLFPGTLLVFRLYEVDNTVVGCGGVLSQQDVHHLCDNPRGPSRGRTAQRQYHSGQYHRKQCKPGTVVWCGEYKGFYEFTLMADTRPARGLKLWNTGSAALEGRNWS